MILFAIAALRALVEMLGLCLMAQGALYLLAGQKRDENPIYRFFALLTTPPRRLLAALLPQRIGAAGIGVICFILLFVLWIGLAVMRKLI